MSNISRRDFLKTGAAAIAGFTIAPSSILGKSHGHKAPSDKLNIAVVGIGGMGHANINAVKNTERVFLRSSPTQRDIGTIVRCTRR